MLLILPLVIAPPLRQSPFRKSLVSIGYLRICIADIWGMALDWRGGVVRPEP